MANLFLGIYFNLSIWFKLTDQTIWGTRLSIGGAIFTILANIITIPMFGYIAAAWVTFFCYFLMALASYFIGQKHFPVSYSVSKILFFMITAVVIQVFMQWIVSDRWPYYLLANGLVMVWGVMAWFVQRNFFLKEA
jgi:O-antigen/teichoic acid export membrane protein